MTTGGPGKQRGKRPDDPILVVGGGIGGLSTGLSLAHRGIDATVFEMAPEFTELGAGLQLAPNATRVLETLGVFDEIARLAVFPRQIVMADALRDEDLVALDLGPRFRDRYGHPYLVMHRHDLLMTLLEACRAAGVRLLPGTEVLELVEGDRDVVARTTAGDFRGRAAIAADGLHSRARTSIVEDELVEEPYVAYRGTVPTADGSPLARTDSVVMWIGPVIHFVQYALRTGEILNQVAVFKSASFGSGDPHWGTPTELETRFAKAGPRVQAGLKAIKRDHRWPMVHRLPAEPWGRGRTTLLGDAAHAMLQYVAQGACQAIEDAYCVATCLAEIDDVEAALRTYERIRAPRTSLVQRAAIAWGNICHSDGVARTLRNEVMARVAPDPYPMVDWMYAYDITADLGTLTSDVPPAAPNVLAL